MQPCSEYPLDAVELPWYVTGDVPANPTPPDISLPWYTNPSIDFWLGIIVALIAVEIWARFGRKHQSPSQWIRKQAEKFRWLQVLGTGLFGFLIWHFFYSERRFSRY